MEHVGHRPAAARRPDDPQPARDARNARGARRATARMPRHSACAWLALALCVGCTTSSERLAASHAVSAAVRALDQRELLPAVALVGGVRRAGVRHEDLAAGHRDTLAEQLARELERALIREDVRVVGHRDMPLAMDVLRLQVSDLYPVDDPDDEAALGRFHQADVLVTAEYVPDRNGHYLLDLRVIDVHTLEILALGEGHSRSMLHRSWAAGLDGAAMLTVPVPVVWDMLRYSTRRSFGDESMSGWQVLGGLLLLPIHLVSSPFLADWDTTLFWLDLDASDASDDHDDSDSSGDSPAGDTDGALADDD